MHLILKCSFRYILESGSFELFFEYVELPNFDIASDALNTFKVNPYVHVFLGGRRIKYWWSSLIRLFQDLLTKHEDVVAGFLSSHYEQVITCSEIHLWSCVNKRHQKKFIDKVSLKHILLESILFIPYSYALYVIASLMPYSQIVLQFCQHARYILFVSVYHSDYVIFYSFLNSTQGSYRQLIM